MPQGNETNRPSFASTPKAARIRRLPYEREACSLTIPVPWLSRSALILLRFTSAKPGYTKKPK